MRGHWKHRPEWRRRTTDREGAKADRLVDIVTSMTRTDALSVGAIKAASIVAVKVGRVTGAAKATIEIAVADLALRGKAPRKKAR